MTAVKSLNLCMSQIPSSRFLVFRVIQWRGVTDKKSIQPRSGLLVDVLWFVLTNLVLLFSNPR